LAAGLVTVHSLFKGGLRTTNVADPL